VSTRRLYNRKTTTFAFRLSPEARSLLDYLAVEDGVSPAHYMRQLFEDHLRSKGFTVDPGAEGVTDPLRGTPAGWRRDHTSTLDPPGDPR
jgi:hypothetical protein